MKHVSATILVLTCSCTSPLQHAQVVGELCKNPETVSECVEAAHGAVAVIEQVCAAIPDAEKSDLCGKGMAAAQSVVDAAKAAADSMEPSQTQAEPVDLPQKGRE